MHQYFHAVEEELFVPVNRRLIPIKPSEFEVAALNPPKSQVDAVTPREVVAILIAAKGARVPVEAGMIVPRSFSMGGLQWVIENGCGQDLVHSRAAGLIPGMQPREDQFVLSRRFVDRLHEIVDAQRLGAFFDRAGPAHLSR